MKFLSAFLLFFLPLSVFAESYETTVSSNEAYYNGETIILLGNVEVVNAMGKICSQKAVLKKDEKRMTRIDFPWIELSKDVVLSLPNGETLKCDFVSIDYVKMTSVFTGIPQVIFSSQNHEILADEAHIDYIEINGSIKPQKIELMQNVRMSHLGSDEKPEEQYALADFVTYFPDQEFMILEGKENKVLFYDKKRDMQLSAKSVHATKNKETKKESVQGIGDVRFIFGPEEVDKLKSRFRWEERK